MEQRITKLEQELAEKDRELREVSINRAEFIQQLNVIYNLLKKAHLNNEPTEIMKRAFENSNDVKLDLPSAIKVDESEVKKDKKGDKKNHKKNDKPGIKTGKIVKDNSKKILEALEPDNLEFMGKYSYRERMILMNRIDIYRLFSTVIIVSSQIKYPRKLTNIEEKELKEFITNLTEFEDLVLDLNIDDNLIWEKGKVCEKQALQLFTRFFNI